MLQTLVQIPVLQEEWVVPTLLLIRELKFLAFPRLAGVEVDR